MPRYFFHMSDGLGRTSDHEGSYFRNEEEARAEALEAAKQVVAGRLTKGRSLDLARAGYIEVTDEEGRVVFKVSLSGSAHAGRGSA
ncbi:MAG: hypothetical protein QOH98_1714 [Methylobacteriaceae bacterium]|jgi:hypothetical protein|nr:hypothetical protein [Methylobacteriaceae bacterium]